MNSAFRDLFFWLSGAGTEELKNCPSWEQRKYVAYGATVLVPSLFAILACGYALSTLTDNWRIIVPVSLAWAFIILSVDRALLASYRAYQPFFNKVGQFALRFVVAALMGLTIAHPLTLLIFRDTISSEIEKGREQDIIAVKTAADTDKEAVRAKITELEANVAAQRAEWDESFNAKFLVETVLPGEGGQNPKDLLPPEVQAQIAEARKPFDEKAGEYGTDFNDHSTKYKTLQEELDYWQREFEREVNGQRSGIVGLGPRAKSIRDDQLDWRREEAKRLGAQVEFLTEEMNRMRTTAEAAEAKVIAEYEAKLAEEQRIKNEEQSRVLALKRQVQEEQATEFVGQQNLMRAAMAKQMETKLAELQGVQEELSQISTDERDRVEQIQAEPRGDILTQSLALHALWKHGGEAGEFAMMAYAILTLLFMLVDTMPLLVKFFSKPGPYDALMDRDELRYAKDRESFIKNYSSYVENLSAGQLGALTQDKPLERALIHGVERSRATKEFLDALFEMERAFEERLIKERERAKAGSEYAPEKVAMLEKMAESFYEVLRERAEEFFRDNPAAASASRYSR